MSNDFNTVDLKDFEKGATLFRVTGNGSDNPGNVQAVKLLSSVIEFENKVGFYASDSPTLSVYVKGLDEPSSVLDANIPIQGEMLLNEFGYDPEADTLRTAFKVFHTQEEAERYAVSDEYRKNYDAMQKQGAYFGVKAEQPESKPAAPSDLKKGAVLFTASFDGSSDQAKVEQIRLASDLIENPHGQSLFASEVLGPLKAGISGYGNYNLNTRFHPGDHGYSADGSEINPDSMNRTFKTHNDAQAYATSNEFANLAQSFKRKRDLNESNSFAFGSGINAQGQMRDLDLGSAMRGILDEDELKEFERELSHQDQPAPEEKPKPLSLGDMMAADKRRFESGFADKFRERVLGDQNKNKDFGGPSGV